MSGPNDKLVRYAFSDVEEAIPLLQSILPSKLVSTIDWSTVQLEPGSFVDSALVDRSTDLLFSSNVSDRPTLLYLLVEHQSSVDREMALRMLRYTVRIWDRWLDDNRSAKLLPRVVPIVVYTGPRKWDAPTAIEDLVDEPHEPWVPHMRFILDDLSGVSDRALEERALSVFGQIVLRLVTRLPRSRDPIRELQSALTLLQALTRGRNGLERFISVLEYLTRVANVQLADVRKVARQVTTIHQEKVMTTLAERMEQEALKRGIEHGRFQGKAELILQMLEVRFGPLSDDVVARIVSASSPDFETWSSRLLVAESLEQVFDDTPLPV